MLVDPQRWWRQKTMAEESNLDDGYVSRVVRRLADAQFLDRDGRQFRPRDPNQLLDAWADEYKFERHHSVVGHMSGSAHEVVDRLCSQLGDLDTRFAFTGLPAAWKIARCSDFRLVSFYVDRDPQRTAEELGLRLGSRGANVQVLYPDDPGVFEGADGHDGLPCVSAPQIYVDLLNLPERAKEAAQHLRAAGLGWSIDER